MTEKNTSEPSGNTPERFQTKPVIKWACKWDGSNIGVLQQWGAPVHPLPASDRCLMIGTLEDGPNCEAVHVATCGDWIIKGLADEFYPCKPDIFANSYERVAASSKEAPKWICPFCKKDKVRESELKRHIRKHVYRDRMAERIAAEATPSPATKDERQEFEEWAKAQCYSIERCTNPHCVDAANHYQENKGTNIAWAGWLARAALGQKSVAPSPASKEAPRDEIDNYREHEPWIKQLAAKIFDWADGYYLHNASPSFGGWKLADLIFEHAPKSVAPSPAREETFEKWFDEAWGKTLHPNSTYAANLREAWDAGTTGRQSMNKCISAADELVASRTAWLDQHGVPISIEFARFVNAIGDAVELLRELAGVAALPSEEETKEKGMKQNG